MEQGQIHVHRAVPWALAMDANDEASVGHVLADVMEVFGPGTGVAWHMTHRGVIQTGAIGRRRLDDPEGAAAPDDLWHWGSCVKALGALLTACVLDAPGSQISWAATVTELLGAGAAVATFSSCTIEQLLTHRGGIVEDLPEGKLASLSAAVQSRTPVEQRAAYVAALAAEPLLFAQGSAFGYSNAGYVLLGHALEVALETPWEQLVQVRVCHKLGMRAGFGVASGPLIGHDEEGTPKPMCRDAGFYVPALSMHASVADWAKLVHVFHAVLKGDFGPAGALGVSEATARKLVTPSSPQTALERYVGNEPPHLYCCGWKGEWAEGSVAAVAPTQTGLLWHMGTNFFFQACVLVSAPADLTLVVACNSGSMAVRVGLREAFERILAAASRSKPAP